MKSRARCSMSSAWSSFTATGAVSGAAAAGETASVSEKRSAVSIDVLSMVLTRFAIDRALRGDVFPLAQFVAHDPYFEEQRRRVDAAPDVLEIRRGDLRRAVHDFEQAPLELVEHARHRSFAGVDGVLAIE